MKTKLKVFKEGEKNKFEQKGQVIWFTGLPCSGKTTLAKALQTHLLDIGGNAIILDGDEIRMGVNSDLGFSDIDRLENVRRIAEFAKILSGNRFIVIVSVITPKEELRRLAKNIIKNNYFSLVYVEATIEVCEKRDVKGLYKKARNREIFGFTGIDDIFEIPLDFNLILNSEKLSIAECVNALKTLIL